jgi:SAM-dependent methyltransferase
MDEWPMNHTADINRLKAIEDLLACPSCRKALQIGDDQIACAGCGARYPIHEGVPLLARLGTPADAKEDISPGDGNTSDPYQKQYQDIRDAAQYNADYKERFLKRMSTRREFSLLSSLLSSQGHCKTILDVPSGGGRLSGQIANFADLMIEADIAQGQVMYGKQNCRVATPQIWMTASAFCLPFRDNSVDATVCCRLCHHLPTEQERAALVTELLRVSRKFVLMTFFDYRSVKNLLRRVRRPFDGQPPKMTMKIEEVVALARRGGASVVQSPYLAPLSSGHRYALMVKDAG